jgi:hypothetical protein
MRPVNQAGAGDRELEASARPLRDLGAWAVLLTARPLRKLWYNSGPVPPTARWSLENIRRAAWERPVDFSDATLAHATRTSAWMALTVFFLIPIVTYGTFFHAGQDFGDAAFAWRVTMYVCLPASAFAAGSLMASGFRWSAVWWWWHTRRVPTATPTVAPQARPLREVGPLVRWLCTPSNADLVPAGLWCGFVSLGVFAP